MTTHRAIDSTSKFGEFRLGSKIVFASFIGLFFHVGTIVIYTFGVFSQEFSREFGWNRIETSLALTAFNLGLVVSAPVYGILIDRLGARPVILVSILLLAPCYATLSLLSGNVAQLYLIFALLALVGGGTLPISYSRILISWFEKSRGLALGIALSGVGIGAAVFPPLLQLCIENYGWRTAAVLIAVSLILVSLPVVMMLLRENPATIAASSSDNENRSSKVNFADRTFWVLVVFSCASGLFLIGALTHFIPILTDRGISAATAASYAAVMGLSVIVGRIGIGAAVDRFFAPRVIFFFYLAPLTAFILLCYTDNQTALLFSAAAFGMALGAEIDVIAYMVSRYFGWQQFGVIYGMQFSCFTIGAAIGPLFMGFMYESSGSYDLALRILAVVTASTALLTFLLPKFRF